MTHAARSVLNDCRVALSLLEDDEEDKKWRVHWAAAVALVRAVGHVLKYVDGKRSPEAAAANNAAHAEWKSDAEEHLIFREFIEKERNNLLKEYRSDVHPISDVFLALEATIVPVHGGEPIALRDVFSLPDNIYRPMIGGAYEGDDARDVLSAAIDWWEAELTKIDNQLRNARNIDV